MTYGSRSGAYPPASKWLHWLVAGSVLTMIPIAIAMVRVGEGPLQNTLYTLHKSFGILVLGLMVARLINRIVAGAPAPEPGLAPWQRVASSATHGLLYVLLILQALGGWLANSAYGAPTPFFGLYHLPNLMAENKGFADQVFAVHRIVGFVIAGLAAIHIAAAFQHYIGSRDRVMQRMLPRALGGD
ncbi:cytochrome b [Bradyrhizobium sp. LHD-71]|uniref:cytochrome b n=1 Tax=Bradyrhizobium sp. LHD-71 TaxID=3072141 RepID=UPI00280EC75C|nr:cytochrome b [Bradyrhizobium sp. LHD-71]MDQ8726316.1 cytochrome b [Bradyrhizobium sp. LHD-71]